MSSVPSLVDRLDTAWASSGSLLCVGLDPDPARLPDGVDVFTFCRDIVDATATVVCAFKPQIAYFAAIGAEAELERLCAHIRDHCPDRLLILDAKRGDIGPTAERYAVEAFDRFGAHAVTVNPYLGSDTVQPFLDRGGVFALCRTSNPGSGDVQMLTADGEPVYLHVARRAAQQWNATGNCGLVAGATYPAELAAIRAAVGTMPLLVPGIGAQGGDIAATVSAGCAPAGEGLPTGIVINSSRAILYASSGPDWAAAAATAAGDTAAAIDAARQVSAGNGAGQ